MNTDLLIDDSEFLTPIYGPNGVLKWEPSYFAILKFDEAKHPRNPSGAPASTGGEFVARAGFRLATPADHTRLKKAGIRLPPAWKNVQVAIDPTADLQATGEDEKGRTQYKYSAAHDKGAAAKKFARLKDFREKLPELRRRIISDLTSKKQRDREAASVLYLIEQTGIRIGSDDDTKADIKAYGATTLLHEHVRVEGDTVILKFPAKSGVVAEKTVEDKRLAAMLSKRLKKTKPGQPLFSTTDNSVRGYMKRAAGFSPKDFRTYQGTAVALQEIKNTPKPESEAAFKKARKAIATVVAEHLGNTPAVALKSYIDPAVWGRLRRKRA